MKLVLFLILVAGGLTSIYAQDVPTMSCQFTLFIGVSHDKPKDVTTIKVEQRMRIVLGKTDEETLRLDGSRRATNSTQWSNITLRNWETSQSTYVGDFGDVLTLTHELGANKRPLRGTYKASLVSTVSGITSILVGTCVVE